MPAGHEAGQELRMQALIVALAAGAAWSADSTRNCNATMRNSIEHKVA